jgi:hypothetical protein
MTLLYVINLLAAFALLLVPLYFSVKVLRLPLLNPFTIVLTVNIPIELMKIYVGPHLLLDAGLFDRAYQFALLMGNLSLFVAATSLIAFYSLFRRIAVDQFLPFDRYALTPRDMRRGARIFLLGFLLSFYILTSNEFGLINWINNPRMGYQVYRVGQGHWYALATSLLSVSMVLSALSDPSPKKIIIGGAFYLILGYFLGSKGLLLSIFSTTLILLWFIRYKNIDKIILLGFPVILFLMIFNLYLALGDLDPTLVVGYFDHYKNAADYYEGYFDGSVNLFYGKIAATSFWEYVPRGVWPEKPFVYGVLHVNEIFFPGQAELTNTPAFAGAVNHFADFGVFGVIIFGLFSPISISSAFLSYLIYTRPGINFKRATLVSVLMLVIMFAPGFGEFFPGAVYLGLLIFVASLIISVRVRRNRLAIKLLN